MIVATLTQVKELNTSSTETLEIQATALCSHQPSLFNMTNIHRTGLSG